MTSILFLCSGGGGSLRFIYSLWENNYLNYFDSIYVICDRKCEASLWCSKKNLNYKIIDINDERQNNLIREVTSLNPSIIITNIFKILNDSFLNKFQDRCINPHWSLLPSFSGLIGVNTIKAALDYKEKIIGATVHHLSEKLDEGRPIVQIAFSVRENETIEFHTDIMFKASAIALFIAIEKITSKNIFKESMAMSLFNTEFLISPFCNLPAIIKDDYFWEKIKNWQ